MALAVGSGSGATLSLNLSPSAWPDGVIAPGDSLCGRVTFVRTTPVTVRGVRLRFKGTAHSRWTTGSGKHRHEHSQTRVICEVLCNLVDFVAGVSMPGGQDTYDFALQVPSLPPSFQGAHGFVKYTLEAYVDIPHWPDISALTTLPVASSQAPTEAICAAPLSDATVVPLSAFCCCGNAGVAELGIALPSRWLAQGIALLDVHAGIAARTDKDLSRGARLSLHERVTYTAGASHCYEERVLGSVPVVPEVLPPGPPPGAPSDGGGRGAPPPPPAHLRRVVLALSGTHTASFDAAGTVSVHHSIVLELPVPWAVSARSSVDVWVYSPHVGLAAMPAGPPPPPWLREYPVEPSQWPKAEPCADPTAV